MKNPDNLQWVLAWYRPDRPRVARMIDGEWFDEGDGGLSNGPDMWTEIPEPPCEDDGSNSFESGVWF